MGDDRFLRRRAVLTNRRARRCRPPATTALSARAPTQHPAARRRGRRRDERSRLRDDLRVDHDAPLFAAALARSPTELIVVYLVEPRDRLRADGPPTEVDSMLEEFGIGDGGFEGARCAMGAFVAQALLDVRDALAARGARLLVLRAPPRAGCVALEPERVLRELVSNEGETVFVASKCAVGAAAAAQARARAALELEVVHDGLCAFCGAWPAELLGDDGSFASFERALLGGARGGRGARSVPPRPEAPAAPRYRQRHRSTRHRRAQRHRAHRVRCRAQRQPGDCDEPPAANARRSANGAVARLRRAGAVHAHLSHAAPWRA